MKNSRQPTERELTLTRMAVISSSISFDVDADEIMNVPRGDRRLTMARQTVYWLLRKADMSFVGIGCSMGKDHVTASHGYNKIEAVLELRMNDGYSLRVIDAFNNFKKFYKPYREREKELMHKKMVEVTEELENALR
mgnify:CR=1 FL=1